MYLWGKQPHSILQRQVQSSLFWSRKGLSLFKNTSVQGTTEFSFNLKKLYTIFTGYTSFSH